MLADDASSHSSKGDGIDLIRQEWAQEECMKEPEKQRGGWSAKGSPVDAVIDKYKHLCDISEDRLLNLCDSLEERTPVHMMPLTRSGLPLRTLDVRQRILLRIHAWLNMPEEILMWAVIARGVVSIEEMARMRDTTVDDINERIHKGNKLTIPLDLSEGLQPVSRSEALDTVNAGESIITWELADAEDRKLVGITWYTLPASISFLVDKGVAGFKREILDLRRKSQAAVTDKEITKLTDEITERLKVSVSCFIACLPETIR